MQYIKLGTTGLDVSPIAIGAMTYGEPDRGHPVWSKGADEARDLVLIHLEEQRFAGGKVAIQRAWPNPGALRDVIHRRVAVLGECVARGVENS